MPFQNKPPRRPWIPEKPKASRWANETHNGVPNQFYRNAPWRHARQRQLEKQPLCEHCLEKKLMTDADTVDHIKPIRLGGDPLDENNLMSLCKSCHARKSAKERGQ